MRRWWARALAAAALVSCAEPPRSVEPLYLDAPIARKSWDGLLLEIGSPAARPHLETGWSYGETAPDGSAFRWAVGDQASLRFEAAAERRRVAWLELEPFRFPGAPTQVVRPRLNGTPLPPLSLREGRGRYPVELPLRSGENVLEFEFAYAGAPSGPEDGGSDRRKLAAAFYRLEIPPEGEEPLAGEPGPFSIVTPRDGEPGMFVPDGGSISFFREIPPGGLLRVQAGASRPERLLAPRGSRLSVMIRSENGEILEKTLEASAPRGEVLALDLPLRAYEGRRTEMRFSAKGSGLLVSPSLLGRDENGAPSSPPSEVREGLNVLVLVLDGAAAGRMSAYGYDRPTTPRIEALAQESVVFEQAVSQAVYTIASIGSLLTGQYPDRHQSVSFADRLPRSAVTVPGLLSLAGFRTAGFAGNAVVSSTFGLDRGYQEFHAAWELEDYTGHGDSVLRLFEPWLEESSDRPFFAYVHFREPHFPYNPPPPFDTRFAPAGPFPDGIEDWEIVEGLNRAAARNEEIAPEAISRIEGLYEGNLAYVDALVGKILDRLDERGLAESTVVFLTADHGEAIFEHRFIGHNTQLYEESIRVPLIVRVPGIGPRRVREVVELVDLAPTILELAGLGAHPAREAMQGRSLLPLLAGRPSADRIAYSRTVWNEPRYAARDGHSKLIWESGTGAWELYDLERDPEEKVNRWAPDDFTAGFLRERLFAWLREQERLRAGAAGPERAVIPEDLGRYLGAVGYLDYLKRPPENEPKEPQ